MTSPTFIESVEHLFSRGLDLPAGPVFDQIRDEMHIAADEAIELWNDGDTANAFAERGKLLDLLEVAQLFAA